MAFTQQYFITQNMIGSLGNKVKPVGILDLFQTTAGLYEKQMGLSMPSLIDRGYCWVLESVSYTQLKDIPELSLVTVGVTAYNPVRVFYDMDFYIEDATGNTLVKGTSRWLIIHIDSRKIDLSGQFKYPVKLTDNLKFSEFKRIKFNFENAETMGYYTVRKSDTDIVGHFNNTRYADVIYEFFPYALKELHIDYLKETKLNQTLEIKKAQVGDYVFIQGESSGEKRFVARFKR